MNPKVNWFFNKPGRWHDAYAELRLLALDCTLNEELKWGCPCYTFNNSNVVLIHGFKDYCALLFIKGALLKDVKKILVLQTKNVQAARQIRFTSVAEVVKLKAVVKSYLKEAIAIEKAGVKVEMKKTTAYTMPDEFKNALGEMEDLKKAFYKLTPGR
jgi:uncharacterized protein YdeI (YjbR/CyaY-like superfamily)